MMRLLGINVRSVLDKLLFILLIVSIPIDSLNGYFQVIVGKNLPISILFRGIILIYLLRYIGYCRWKLILQKLFSVIFLFYLFSFAIWSLFNSDFSFPDELSSLFKILYFWSVIFFFIKYRLNCDNLTILKTVTISSLLIAIINILCFFCGWGIVSYGEDFSRGTSAFYVDGNALGMYMILSLVFAIYYAFVQGKFKWYIVAFIITFGTMLIGSRTGLIGTIGIWFTLLVYFFFSKMRKSVSTQIVIFVLLIGFIFSISHYFSYLINMNSFSEERFSQEALLSPRERLKKAGWEVIYDYEGYELIVGKGRSGATNVLGNSLRLFEPKGVESDFQDQILYYGWGLGSAFCLLYMGIVISFIRAWMKSKVSINLIVVFVGILWLFMSYMGGHGFANVQIAPILGCCFALLTRRENFYALSERK